MHATRARFAQKHILHNAARDAALVVRKIRPLQERRRTSGNLPYSRTTIGKIGQHRTFMVPVVKPSSKPSGRRSKGFPAMDHCSSPIFFNNAINLGSVRRGSTNGCTLSAAICVGRCSSTAFSSKINAWFLSPSPKYIMAS
jgi:hypothetical protein